MSASEIALCGLDKSSRDIIDEVASGQLHNGKLAFAISSAIHDEFRAQVRFAISPIIRSELIKFIASLTVQVDDLKSIAANLKNLESLNFRVDDLQRAAVKLQRLATNFAQPKTRKKSQKKRRSRKA